MANNQKLILITAALAAVIVAGGAWFTGGSPDPSTSTSPTALSQPANSGNADPPAGEQQTATAINRDDPRRQHLQGDERERREAHTRQTAVQQIRDALQHSLDNPGNLQAFFDHLERICAGARDCHDLLDEALEDIDPDTAAMIHRIHERLPAYHAEMQRTRMSMDMSPQERYDTIHRLREVMLGVEETEALFGQEQSFAEFRFSLGELNRQATDMSFEERRQAIIDLRQQAYGEYTQQLAEEEGDMGRYRHELNLMLQGVEDPQTRQQITRQVRERHLDADTIHRLEDRDEQVEEQQAEVQSYQKAAQAIEADMEAKRDTLPPDEWEAEFRQRMTELRQEHFD